MILLWKAVVLEVGWRGCKRTPNSFDLLKIWVKALKIRVKMAPNVVWLQKMAPNVCIKTHETLFWRLHQKEVFMIFVGENLWAKVAQKLFGQNLGNSGEILHPRNLPASAPMMKSHLRPRRPSFERTEGERTPPCLHSPARLCITRTFLTRCCSMQCVTAMNINYISGLLRQSNSWLQKYPATR